MSWIIRIGSTPGRVFFNSEEALLAADHNQVSDVYEWDNGQLSLISSGQAGAAPSRFADADEAGENAYFTTRDQLLPQDRDQLTDLYDARVGGGFPFTPAAPACGEGDCHTGSTQGAASTDPASARFNGPGNGKPATPPKRHRKKHHKRHHRKHHSQGKGGKRG